MNHLFTTMSAAVFAGVFLLDFVWARYNIATAEKRVLLSATYAAAVYLLSGAATILFVTDPWMLAPGAAGGAVGTAASVWSLKRGG